MNLKMVPRGQVPNIENGTMVRGQVPMVRGQVPKWVPNIPMGSDELDLYRL